MKRLLLIPLVLFVLSCEETGLNTEGSGSNTVTDTLYIFHDTTITVIDTIFIETESILIDLEFVVIKNYSLGEPSINPSDINETSCSSGSVDCAGNCDGDAVEQIYYYDNDGDGLGGDYSEVICSAFVPDYWVLNSDDDDDTIEFCWIFYTLNLLEEDLETTNGNISFTYDEEDFSIDVTSCIEIGIHKTTRILQDIELEILYLFEDSGFGNVYSYSSPNELLFVK